MDRERIDRSHLVKLERPSFNRGGGLRHCPGGGGHLHMATNNPIASEEVHDEGKSNQQPGD